MADEKTSNLDITRVIDKSTSDVAVSDLAKKGFKQVKVLKRRMILELIGAAVDRVIADREQIGAEERERVIRESKQRFEGMVREKLETERDLERIRGENGVLVAKVEALQKELARANGQLAQRECQITELEGQVAEAEKKDAAVSTAMNQQFMMALLTKIGEQSGRSKPDDISALQASIEGLADRISRMGGGGGGGGAALFTKDVDFERLFSMAGSESLESNVADIKVKESKAGGVKSTLAKLKALQQGGAKDGE